MAAEFLGGNRLTLLHTGSEYFPALVAALDSARHEVYLETYLYEDDATGRRVTDALCRAAQRGAAVRVLVDGFGARDSCKRACSRWLRYKWASPNVWMKSPGLWPVTCAIICVSSA